MINYFKLNEIPYSELKDLGIKEKDILKRDDDVAKLLSGKMTDFFKLNLRDLNVELEAKLSLIREGQKVSLMIHPIMKEIDKSWNLSEKEKEVLEKGDLVVKEKDGVKHLVQLDKETKTLITMEQDKLEIPDKYRGHVFSNEEKLILKNAGKVKMPNSSRVKIDFQNLYNVTTETQLNVDINMNQEIGR